jgi:5-methylcytosine-specific restriction endonuclease McrA
VGEPKAVADDLDDAVLERRIQATVDLGRIGRGSDRIQRRCRQGRDDLERFEGMGGKPFEAVLDEYLKPLGDRGRPASTADHLVGAPHGTHELSNLVPACARCNRLRGASRGGQVAKAKRKRAAQEPPGAQR